MNMRTTHRVAVVQAASVPFQLEPTMEKAVRLIREAGARGAELALFPEAFIGSYPKGCDFKTPVGARLPGSRDIFRNYFAGSLEVSGRDTGGLRPSRCVRRVGRDRTRRQYAL